MGTYERTAGIKKRETARRINLNSIQGSLSFQRDI